MGALMGVVLLESPWTYAMALPTLMEYIGHVLNILQIYAPYSTSLHESYLSLKRKHRELMALRG